MPPETGLTRTVIVHHHIFKCAGTSVDRILARSFPGSLLSGEPRTRAAAEDWIATTAQGRAYTSHHAPLGLAVGGVRILPVVFIREPLSRIVSAYGFERRQGEAGHDGPGAKLAARHDLAGWLRHRLDTFGDRQVRNLQSHRLATYLSETAAPPEGALAVAEQLPFVGLVEAFDVSLDTLTCIAAREGLALAPGTVHENTGGYGAGARDALGRLPAALQDEVVAANAADAALHRAVAARYGVTVAAPIPARA